MSINLIIAFSNLLFSEGISELLKHENGIKVVKILDPGSKITAELWNSLAPDVVLVDFTTLYNGLTDLDALGPGKKHPFILLDTNCGKENIISAVLKKRVSGVLPGHSDLRHLAKAIKAVAKGDIWIDKATVKNLLHGIKALNDNQASTLTPREKGVVDLIEKGLRNKEIARKLHISEPTVKTHLYRIYRKLNIRTRSELITYAIKKSGLNYGPF
jgi:DNA-binding NarL/FixJ family response regulator